MKKNVLLLFLIIFTVSSSAITLDQGWNTLSVNSEVDISDAIEESDAKEEDNSCEFEQYEGEYIWKYDNVEDDWTHPNTLQPGDGFYLYTDNNCELEVDQSSKNDIDSLEMDSGWNMIGASDSQLSKVRSSCEITPHLENGYFSFLLNGEWYHPLISGSEMDNRGYWLSLGEESCQVDFDEELDEPEDQPVEDSYLEFDDAEVTSETVSADGNDLEVDFRFDRDSDIRNDVEAEVGIHIDESSSPVKTFEVPDKDETQELSVAWQDIWEEVGESETDATVQLVLQEKTEGDFRWNGNTIDVGEFYIERCSNFDSEMAGRWEIKNIEYNSEKSCLREVSVKEGSDGEYEFKIESNERGLNGKVTIKRTYFNTTGDEKLKIDLTTLDDVESLAMNQESDLEIRHYEGGPSDSDENRWKTLLEGEVRDIEPKTIYANFTRAKGEYNNYNIVTLSVSNDFYNSESALTVAGTFELIDYAQDGRGTCPPEEIWCGSRYGEGDCIDEEDYRTGICY